VAHSPIDEVGVRQKLLSLFNHAHFIQALKREVLRAGRHGLKLSRVMFDLDGFKRVNDTRGHLEGDHILTKTAAVIQESLREIDTAARYGGEEFAIRLPETSRAGAHVVADRIRRRIEDRFRRRGATHETISGGVATYPEDAIPRTCCAARTRASTGRRPMARWSAASAAVISGCRSAIPFFSGPGPRGGQRGPRTSPRAACS
jgi:diguanylate cyclase (GGDEF)-like protein